MDGGQWTMSRGAASAPGAFGRRAAEAAARIRSRRARSRSVERGQEAAPVRTHPVRTAVLCVLVVALLSVPAVFANTAIGYIPPVAAASLALVCAVYLAVIRRGIGFSAGACDRSCTRGEKLRFPLTVTNNSILPAPRIEVVFYVSDIFGQSGRYQRSRLTLPPRSSKEFDLGIRFDHIGVAKVGIEQVLVFDPLGLFASAKENGFLEEVAVVPRKVSIESPELSDRSLKEAQKNIRMFINDGMDYSGVREYHWGDPMKSIHWKLSSKATAEYFTRLYETPTMPGMEAVIDFECPDDDPNRLMDVYDTLAESALAAELGACLLGFETELVFVREDGVRRRLKGPMEGRHAELMRHIPRIGTGSGEAALELLRDEISSAHCQNNLVVCTCNLTRQMVDVLVTARGRSLYPHVLFVDVEPADVARAELYDEKRAESLGRLHAAHIPYTIVKHAVVEAGADDSGVHVDAGVGSAGSAGSAAGSAGSTTGSAGAQAAAGSAGASGSASGSQAASAGAGGTRHRGPFGGRRSARERGGDA